MFRLKFLNKKKLKRTAENILDKFLGIPKCLSNEEKKQNQSEYSKQYYQKNKDKILLQQKTKKALKKSQIDIEEPIQTETEKEKIKIVKLPIKKNKKNVIKQIDVQTAIRKI